MSMMLDSLRSTRRRHVGATGEDDRKEDVVLFIDDLTALLRVSRSTIERRLREGTFPIPTLDPLDRRPRWSRKAAALQSRVRVAPAVGTVQNSTEDPPAAVPCSWQSFSTVDLVGWVSSQGHV